MNHYMLLSRLQQDCDYYLNFGGRQPKHLWAGEEKAHISKMKEIYNALEIKPEWITLEEIEQYEKSFFNNLSPLKYN